MKITVQLPEAGSVSLQLIKEELLAQKNLCPIPERPCCKFSAIQLSDAEVLVRVSHSQAYNKSVVEEMLSEHKGAKFVGAGLFMHVLDEVRLDWNSISCEGKFRRDKPLDPSEASATLACIKEAVQTSITSLISFEELEEDEEGFGEWPT